MERTYIMIKVSSRRHCGLYVAVLVFYDLFLLLYVSPHLFPAAHTQ